MLELVRRARRRLLHNELFSQGANAFCAALAAFILLLLVGTEILNWYWILLIPFVAAGIGLYRAYKHLPSHYRTAQLVDRRMALADTVSTAWFFRNAGDSQASEDLRNAQFQKADQLAHEVDVARAVPYVLPRSAYAMAALFLVASSLFALRYGVSHELNLKAPLARMFQDKFTPADHNKQVAENSHKGAPQVPPSQDDESAAAAAEQEKKGDKPQDSPSDDPSEQGAESSSGKSGDKEGGEKQTGDQQKQAGDSQDQQGDQAESQESGKNGATPPGDNKSEKNNKQSDGKESANNSSDSSSLISKMKDAFQNLFAKPKPQQGASAQQPQNQASKQGNSQKDGKSQQSKDGQQQGSQQAEGEEGQPGENQKDQQDSQGKGQGKSDSQQASKQPGSGQGSEDGSKQIRDAALLAAMGRTSEIIGKRSAAVTGEATVEVQNTSQQLHTAYVQKGSQHTQGGAEINRDEIPVALQPFVEQYFDQLRKQPGNSMPAAHPAVKKD